MSFDKIDKLLNDPTVLFSNDGKAFDCVSLLESLKSIVDPLIESTSDCVLDEIYVDGLDATQVWGQVKLVFDGAEKEIWGEIEKFKAEGTYEDEEFDSEEGDEEEGEDELEHEEEEANVRYDSEDYAEPDEQNDDEDDSEFGDDGMPAEEEENDVSEEDDEEGDSEEVEETTAASSKDFGLNDEFFNLDDYKRQVLALEDNDNDDADDEEIDYFGDMSDEDEEDEEMYTYDDFFDPKGSNSKGDAETKGKKGKKERGKKKEFAEEDYDEAYDLAQADIFGDEEEEDDEEVNEESPKEERLSTFEKQQRELARQIAELEAESIAEKKWTMKGEVSGKQRESDTLLDEDLEFDRTAKPVPVITQEVTESIEDIIKRRITNQEFDEIPKRIISELNNFRASKKVQVSEEKSSKSLAELYEDEYAGKSTGGSDEISESLKAAHDEISELFKDVTYQLDSLYSSHFVPKPKEKLLDVRIETSTIAMEDAQPLTMSSGNSLAPQEVYKVGNTKVGKEEVILRSGVVMAKAELERDDKQRLHRARKRKQHLASKDESLKKQKVETSQL